MRPLTRYLAITLAVATAMLVALKLYVHDFKLCQQAYFNDDTAHTLEYCARPRAVTSLYAHHRALSHEYLGVAYLHSGQYPKAIAEETATIALDPRPAAYGYRGQAYLENGQFDAAIADFRTAIALRPTDPWNYHDLAVALWQQGELAAAVAAASDAIQHDRNAPDEYLLRAEIYATWRKVDLAVKDARQALRLALAGDDFTAHSALCRYLTVVKATGDAMGDCAMLAWRNRSRAKSSPRGPAFAESDQEFAKGHVEAGMQILLKLANDGNPQAMREIGDMHRVGAGGTPRNNSEAMTWYLKAAATGDADSEAELGTIYVLGKFTPQNYPEARRLYRLAAMQGQAAAAAELSEMYFKGIGTDPDPAEAMKWLRLAANTGYGWHGYLLGSHYETGDGTAQNKVLAYLWYDIDVRAYEGTDSWRTALDRLSKQMPEADLRHAEYLAARCVNSGYRDCDDTAGGR